MRENILKVTTKSTFYEIKEYNLQLNIILHGSHCIN